MTTDTLGLVPVPDRELVEELAALSEHELRARHDEFRSVIPLSGPSRPDEFYALHAAIVCERLLACFDPADIVDDLTSLAVLYVAELREPIAALMAEYTPSEELEAALDVWFRVLARQPVPRDEHAAAMSYLANLFAANEAGAVGGAPLPLIEAVAGLISQKGNPNNANPNTEDN